MKIIYNRFIPFGQYLGINLFGILFVRKEYEADMKSNIQMRKEVINHEQIHTAQMQELWYIPFYLIYIFWHIKLLLKTRNNTEAYRPIRTRSLRQRPQPELPADQREIRLQTLYII